LDTSNFTPLTRQSEADYLPYAPCCRFGDTTFSSLYAWQPMFGYRYLRGDGWLLTAGLSAGGAESCILMRDPARPLPEVLRALMPRGPLRLEYIPEQELPAYEAAAAELGLALQADAEEAFSDYVYRTADYCSLAGRAQKSLRGDVNALLRQYPDIRTEPYRPELADVVLGIFDLWCGGRRCGDCAYGCERKALARFLQVYREPVCFGLLAYSGDTPLSFLMGQILPDGVLDIHFQKNTVRRRGLTYWLSRELALREPGCPWLDLEEDMGIPGIRLDKQRLHPHTLKKKYTVLLEPER